MDYFNGTEISIYPAKSILKRQALTGKINNCKRKNL